MNGHEYFRKLEIESHVADLDPDVAQEGRRFAVLKRGPAASPLGGRITTDLKRVAPEDIARRRAESEAFLKQPVVHVPYEAD